MKLSAFFRLALVMAFVAPAAAMAIGEEVLDVEINKGTLVHLNRPAASVVISDPNTADVQVVSPKLILVRGKKIGETSFYAIDAQDETIIDAVVHVTHNISDLERTIKRIAPNADVGFKTVDGGLVMDGVTGSVAESEDIRNVASTFIGKDEKMVNMIRSAGSDQVTLKVKIVEMKRTDLKTLGLNLQSFVNHKDLALQLLQGNSISVNGSGVLQRSTNTDTNIFAQYKSGGTTIGGVIDALETQGLANVLAEPNLTTTSGQAASFLAGGQFPIPVVQSSAGGAPTVTIQYQPFGVSLKFTPVVMSHDRMSITVAPEVSTLDFSNPIQVSGVTYPILLVRQASAVVELGSGDSFMLAGLLQNETSNTINKFPGLGDLPVLGTLFRSTQFQNDETELVILVTPYLVHPVAESAKLQTPLDGYVPPNDLQLLMTGNLYQQQPMQREEKAPPAMPKLHGDGGFIEE